MKLLQALVNGNPRQVTTKYGEKSVLDVATSEGNYTIWRPAEIELKICDAIDAYNDAVASGNDELAQMIHLSELRFDRATSTSSRSENSIQLVVLPFGFRQVHLSESPPLPILQISSTPAYCLTELRSGPIYRT